MDKFDQLNDLAKKLCDVLPAGLKEMPGDMQQRFHDILRQGLLKMDLVTREEFDVQMKVIQRLSNRLDDLEKKSSPPD